MALSFSFPIGKAKKRDSFSRSSDTTTTRSTAAAIVSGDLREGVDSESPQYSQLLGKTHNNIKQSSKGPKSWKSFPSLSFFKDTHSIPSNNSNSPSSSVEQQAVVVTSNRSTNNSKISSAVGKPQIITSGSRLPIRANSVASSNKSPVIGSSIPALSNNSGINNPPPIKTEGNLLQFRKVTGSKTSHESASSDISRSNKLSSGKSLPDVTDTESPKPLSAYPAGKPCDLLAQLQLSVDKQSTSDSKDSLLLLPSSDNNGQVIIGMERDFINRVSSFDDNGNPCAPHNNPALPPLQQHPQIPDDFIVDDPKVEEHNREIKTQSDPGDEEQKESGHHELLDTIIDFQVGESASSQEKVKSPLLLEDHHTGGQSSSDSKECAGPPDELHSATLSSNISTSSTSREFPNPKESEEDDDDEPKYFINAAALSEDDTFVLPPSPAPSPCNFKRSFVKMTTTTATTNVPPKQKSSTSSEDPEEEPRTDNEGPALVETLLETQKATLAHKESQADSSSCSSAVIRPRVPVSKSYPDIVQTTFNNDDDDNNVLQRGMTKENSDLESLVADSLENLAVEVSNTGETCNKKEISVGSQQHGGTTPSGGGRSAVKSTAGESFALVSPKSTGTGSEAEMNVSLQTKPFKAFDSPGASLMQQSGLMMSGSSIMSESQMGGIFAEKPPEAWVIDFNSLSMDSEIDMSSQRNKSESGGSNSNSLAFFVNMDDCKTNDGGVGGVSSSERRGSGDSTESKKIFSMFVDMSEQQGSSSSTGNNGSGGGTSSSSSRIPSGIAQLRKPVVNKPVVNVMETSTGSLKSLNRRFPSPIFQHKAAAEAARQAARLEWEKQKEKYYDSLEPNSILMMGGVGFAGCPPQFAGGGGPGPGGGDLGKGNVNNVSNPMGESTVSNRSSLHVANVLESSFSSSIISSMETSQPAELEICQGGPCFKLGKDLLRMFQEGINTDVNINVNGKWIKAHKCILASRSQYFAAILSGHWVEKAGNTINLDGFSYSVVQFALYHIYSGTNEIPDTIDLMELATLTDLLGLEGLRENISQTFRVKFCHNFHRPCTGCITGVLECFPIAGAYGMDELHRKMTKWICKHFVRIWPTKGFASLGDELIDKCLRYSVNHLSIDNILDHTLGCDQLLSTMPTLRYVCNLFVLSTDVEHIHESIREINHCGCFRWTEPIFSIVNQLAAECIQFVGEHLCDVLQSQKFLQFGKGQAWNISRIEGTFTQAMDLLKPDEACLSHTALARLIELGTLSIDEVEWSASFMDFLKMLRDEVEKYLFANASKAVLSRCWEQLGQDVRKRICNTSFVGFDKFGNKIVKNTGASTGGRNSSRPSSSSNTSNTRSHGASNTMKSKHSSTNNSSTLTKIASVRPMQSQQHAVVETPVTPVVAQTLPSKSSSHRERPSSASKATKASDHQQTQLSNLAVTSRNSLRSNPHKSMSMDREKSFNSANSRRTSGNSGSTASSTASANRTPIKPLTPSVPPSKPSPLTVGYEQSSPSSLNNKPTRPAKTSTGSTNRNQKIQQSPKPQEPPKKTFLTNSAKAAAVSKPLLKPVSKKTPTSSVSSLNSQHGTNDVQQSGNKYVSKYAPTTSSSSLAVKSSGGFSARSSFSNVERPAAVKSKVDSNPPRRNTFGQSHTGGHTTIPTKVRRPASSGTPVVRGTLKHPSVGNPSGHSSMPPVSVPSTASFDFDSLNDSYSRENVMSRSTIETESGEVKMRTLAEIGRSSTFSKDEPTILGKLDMEGSGYGNIDMDYDEYE